MKKNTCILFSGGNYGTFVEWCLNYFTNLEFSDELPFNPNGNSHQFIGNHLLNFKGGIDYVTSDKDYQFVRFHPKTIKEENIESNLQFINAHFNKVIYLTSTVDSIAWIINNKFTKIWNGNLGWIVNNESQLIDNIKQWGSKKTATNMGTWEYREFLSLYIYQQHLAETELLLTPKISQLFPNFNIVDAAQLRDSFSDTLLSIIKYCELTPVRLDKIDYIYKQWISIQHHAYKDKLINDIIDAILNYQEYNWSAEKLTIVDEALIQHYLRLHGLLFKCYNLNIFPSDTSTLRTYFE